MASINKGSALKKANSSGLDVGGGLLNAESGSKSRQRYHQHNPAVLSTPGSATTRTLLVQNFYESTVNGSRWLENSSKAPKKNMAKILAPSTAHPSVTSHRHRGSKGDDGDRHHLKSSASGDSTSSGDDSDVKLGSSSFSVVRNGSSVDKMASDHPLRPWAAHPKRRQSAASNGHSSSMTGEDGLFAVSNSPFVESSVEIVSPPTPSGASLGLLNNNTFANSPRPKLTGRNNTEMSGPPTARTNVSIPNWAISEDYDDQIELTSDSNKMRVERWLDSATLSGKSRNQKFSQKGGSSLGRSVDLAPRPNIGGNKKK